MKILENAFEKFSYIQFTMKEIDNSQFDARVEVDDEFLETRSKLFIFKRKFLPQATELKYLLLRKLLKKSKNAFYFDKYYSTRYPQKILDRFYQ